MGPKARVVVLIDLFPIVLKFPPGIKFPSRGSPEGLSFLFSSNLNIKAFWTGFPTSQQVEVKMKNNLPTSPLYIK